MAINKLGIPMPNPTPMAILSLVDIPLDFGVADGVMVAVMLDTITVCISKGWTMEVEVAVTTIKEEGTVDVMVPDGMATVVCTVIVVRALVQVGTKVKTSLRSRS